jgi:hypothetical protein
MISEGLEVWEVVQRVHARSSERRNARPESGDVTARLSIIETPRIDEDPRAELLAERDAGVVA